MDWSRFPLREMATRGWIPKHARVKERTEELVRDFIAWAGGAQAVHAVAFRKGRTSRLNEKTDPYALTAWCLRVLGIARRHPLEARDPRGAVGAEFMREVAKLSYFEEGPLLAREYLQKNGIHLIVVPHLAKTYLDGAAMRTPEGVPVIGMTLRYDRLDNFWFCLLHELAHVARHLSSASTVIVDDLDLRRQGDGEDQAEEEADRMAGRALIPEKVWKLRDRYGKGRARQVTAMAEELKIHPAIVAGRMRFEENNYRILSRYVGRGQVRKHFPGFDEP
jgi:HTH-type transcriptional regulator/antitoxin HigA